MAGVERLLWSRLPRRQQGGLKFRRQVPLGPYVVNFSDD
jgi:very-short-patch-repair endonuclease